MEEIKDLGGLVNKDLAFSKLPQGAVFDSENFRITTDDGNTSAARQNIRGNKAISGIPQLPCLKSITFDTSVLNTLMVPGEIYDIVLTVNAGIAPTLTFIFSNFNTFLSDLNNFINTDSFFVNSQITSYISNQNIYLGVPNCETIGVNYFGVTVPRTGYTSFPYRIFDEEFAIENYNGSSYNANLGYVPVPQWSLIDELLPTGGSSTYSTGMSVGIQNSAGVTINNTSTVLTWESNSTGQGTDVMWFGDPFYATSFTTTTPSLFEYFTGGPYDIQFKYYIAKSVNAEVTVQILLDIGQYVDPAKAALYGLTLVTIPAIGYSLILVDTATYTSGAGNTDINYITAPYGFIWNIPGLTSWKDLLFPGASYEYNGFVLRVQGDNDSSLPGPPSHNFKTYFDSFKVQGPHINLTGFATITNVIVPAQFGLIIGWVALRDDIYLFTTDGTYDPDDPNTWGGINPPITNGQIWKFSYDKSSDYSDSASYFIGDNLGNYGIPVYAGLLNFTTCRPIANPGMIEARYESPAIQKIYWTDNYNVPRQINVADPAVAGLPVEDLNLQPSLTMDLPFVTQVEDSGVLPMGVYQVAYRLKNLNGSETRFSRTSNLIPIIDRPEANATSTTYYPVKNVRDATQKSLRVEVSNLDTDYDTIEFATLYYFDEFSEPEISIVKEAFIPDTGVVETYITGSEVAVPITVDEFTAFTTYIKRAKTLAAKKQTLFLGNVTIGSQEVDFDARAYRFPLLSNTTKLTVDSSSDVFTVTYNSAANFFQITDLNGLPVAPYDVPQAHDAIQDYDAQSPLASNNLLYQPNSDVLGGKGPNVTYEFFTDNIKLDNKFDDSPAGGAYSPHMTADVNAAINFNDGARTYVAQGSSLSNNNSPYVYDLYVGYKRDEMYRFGIVFFDELDNPTYVNWIADIRMPHIFMPGKTNGAFIPSPTLRSRVGVGQVTSFSSDTVFWDNSVNDLYGKPLGVKFTIDFSSVADKYKKAMIVRVPLKATDKHILGQGLFRPTYKTRGAVTDSSRIYVNNPYRGNYAYTIGANIYNDAWFDAWVMNSPEFLFKDFTTLGNDEVDVLGLLYKTDFAYMAMQPLGGNNNYWVANSQEWNIGDDKRLTAFRLKNYQLNEGAGTPASIKNAATLNPYPVILAKSLPLAGTQIMYDTGITTLGAASGGFPTNRIVHNCSPRDPAITTDMKVSNGNNPGASYNGRSLFIQLAQGPASNWNNTPFGNDFLSVDGWDAGVIETFHFYLANYKRKVPAPFGGHGYFARANSEYIDCKNIIDLSNKAIPKTVKVYGGDTTVAVMDQVIQFPDRAFAIQTSASTRSDVFHTTVFFPVETSIAVDFRRSVNNTVNVDHNSGVPNRAKNISIPYDIASSSWNTQIEVSEHFEIDPVFNHTDKTVYRYFPKPVAGIATEYDCRVFRSEKKIDGETIDSWSVYKPGAFLDVEAAYGPLNNLVVFQDKLYFMQDRGFGVLQVSEQKLINDQAGNADLVLGSSGILERYDYISTQTGTKHQFSMSVSDYSMIWFDTLARKMYRFKPGALEPLSDMKGYGGYLYSRTDNTLQTFDNPYYMNTTPGLSPPVWEGRGVHSTYDYRHHEFYMTFLNPDAGAQFTLVYNDLFDGYVGRYGHMPKVYINDKVNIFSPWLDPLAPNMFETIYVHNYGDYGRFYGTQFAQYSYLAFVVNSNPTLEKTFTNLEIVAEAYSTNTVKPAFDPNQYDTLAAIDYSDFFEQMRVYDNYQNTDWQFLDGSSGVAPVSRRRHKTIWNLKVLSDRVLDVNNNIFDIANLDVLRPRITRRLKDKWFVVELKYNNNPNNRFVVHSAKAIYSANSR